MPSFIDITEFHEDIRRFLVGYYAVLAAMNAVAAAVVWRSGRATCLGRVGRWRLTAAPLWLLVGVGFAGLGGCAWSGSPAALGWLSLPEGVKRVLDDVMQPTWYVLGTFAALAGLFLTRRFFVRPWVAWSGLNLGLLFLGLSLTDPDFARIVGKPDNVPIVGMVFLLGFFTWLGAYRAVENDDRIARDEPTIEAAGSEKVLVWPDLVYIELICMVAVTAGLILWSLALQAPLEEPANPVTTPNPSKAPWYFLGLQEMLVYFDPWLAGVVLPGLIIFGLMAVPYLDFNPHGSGYYTIRQRRFAYVVFQFGFLALWVTLILIGTFIRGPGWNAFGLYEPWDPHKVANLENVSLSEYFWVWLLHMPRPTVPAGAGAAGRLGFILLRELPGLVCLTLYFFVLPTVLAAWTGFFRNLYQKLGRGRYAVLMFLLLVMLLLPIKMLGRWTANLSYVVSIPEYLLNL